jgi:hypothetical protein
MSITFATAEELQLLMRLEEVAKAKFQGHLTILRFTTNWRIGFYQPADRDQIQKMSVGSTFREAALAALAAEGSAFR